MPRGQRVFRRQQWNDGMSEVLACSASIGTGRRGECQVVGWLSTRWVGGEQSGFQNKLREVGSLLGYP